MPFESNLIKGPGIRQNRFRGVLYRVEAIGIFRRADV
jgi:hypothetical protein